MFNINQDLNSPYRVNTTLARWVMGIQQIINFAMHDKLLRVNFKQFLRQSEKTIDVVMKTCDQMKSSFVISESFSSSFNINFVYYLLVSGLFEYRYANKPMFEGTQSALGMR